MVRSIQVTFDAANPDTLARFWAAALDYVLQPPPEGYASWEDVLREWGVPEDRWDAASAIVDPQGKGPRIYFQKVPESKVAKNRVHLDVNVSVPGMPIDERRERVDRHVQRLTQVGATHQRTAEEQGEYWVVMQDPEGNEFCVQ